MFRPLDRRKLRTSVTRGRSTAIISAACSRENFENLTFKWSKTVWRERKLKMHWVTLTWFKRKRRRDWMYNVFPIPSDSSMLIEKMWVLIEDDQTSITCRPIVFWVLKAPLLAECRHWRHMPNPRLMTFYFSKACQKQNITQNRSTRKPESHQAGCL